MRAFVRDLMGYLSVVEVNTITATTEATTHEESIQKELHLNGNDDAVEGLYIVSTDGDFDELFIPCEDVDGMLAQAFSTGMIDLSSYENVYDAEDWYLFA